MQSCVLGTGEQWREIDMSGQVRFSDMFENRNKAVGMHRLKGFAGGRALVTVIDDQCCATLVSQAG